MPTSVEASSNATLGGKKWAAALVGTRGPGGERADAPMLGSRWRNTQSSSMLSLLCQDWTTKSNWNWGMKSLFGIKTNSHKLLKTPFFTVRERCFCHFQRLIHLMVFIATSGFCGKKPSRWPASISIVSWAHVLEHGIGLQLWWYWKTWINCRCSGGSYQKKNELTNGLGYPKMMGIVKMWLRLYASFWYPC